MAGGGGAAATVLAAYRDDFSAAAGAINGRSFKGNSWITALDNTTAGNPAYTVAYPTIVATGKGTAGSGNAAGNKAHTWHVPSSVYDYFNFKVAVVTQGVGNFAVHQQVDPSAQTYNTGTPLPFGGMLIAFNGGTGGAIITAFKADGTSIATGGLGAVDIARSGDIFEPRTVNIAGTDYLQIYQNGRLTGPVNGVLATTYYTHGMGYNLTTLVAAGMPAINGKNGFDGKIPAASIDWVEAADPTTHFRLINTVFGRTMNVKADGSSVFVGSFKYTGPAPTALKYVWRNAADNSIAVGPASVTNFTATDGTGTYALPPFTPMAANQYFAQVYEDANVVGDDGQPNVRMLDTPYLDVGKIVLSQGQSNMGNADSGTAGTSPTLPVQQYLYWPPVASANLDAAGHAPLVTNGAAGTSTKIPAWYLAYAAPVMGNGPATYLAAGVGGTTVAQRGPGGSSGIYESVLSTINSMGGSIDHVRWADGESDVATAQAMYKAGVYTILDGLSAQCGYTVPVMMEGIGTIAVLAKGNDVSCESMRRLQMFTMPAERPGQIIPAAFSLDLQHLIAGTVSNLHFSNPSYGERTRRSALSLRNFRNPGTYTGNRLGPKLVSARRVDSTHIGVTFALGDFTNMAMSAGMAYTAGKTDVYGGGIRFGTAVGTPSGATSATLTGGFLIPNGAPAVGTVSGGQVEVTWPFASVPATVYVTGPYGQNPFNPDYTGTSDAIELDFANKASILQGTIAGEPTVAIQPYWHTSGNDYLTAT